ncbi:hypothetical protein GOARA_008_00520 [Gordonia araii NBRC 100433]|uniref:AB hydrolase-1 domain-containing protein n=2 Tax=Gordonia araii TaxID=263909 RepID=G7GXM7_9ACTN|nr:hypothetical protein GOARA_008_00520 [Gordonia araii NBRC 100433]
MGVPAKFYRPLVDAIAERGWPVSVVPRRGIEPGDEPPSRRNDWSYADEAGDLAAAVAAIRTSDPTRRIVVLGHSLGAQLCAQISSDPDLAHGRPDGFVTVAGSVPWFRCYPLTDPAYLLAAAVPVVTTVEGRWPANLFGGPTPRTLMREWARMVRTGATPFPDPDDGTGGASGSPIPTLAVRLPDDRLVTTPAAEMLERHFAERVLTVWNYPRHLCPPDGSTDHVKWVRTPGPVVDRIVDWWASTPTSVDHGSVSV